jgi:hypothetical protein
MAKRSSATAEFSTDAMGHGKAAKGGALAKRVKAVMRHGKAW